MRKSRKIIIVLVLVALITIEVVIIRLVQLNCGLKEIPYYLKFKTVPTIV